ncbi:MAG TPA: hypothetical protein VF583_20130 [Bradyrhizobium sp.]
MNTTVTVAPLNLPVMAGLVPAIHDLTLGTEDVDARVKPGHDDVDRFAS